MNKKQREGRDELNWDDSEWERYSKGDWVRATKDHNKKTDKRTRSAKERLNGKRVCKEGFYIKSYNKTIYFWDFLQNVKASLLLHTLQVMASSLWLALIVIGAEW